MWPMWKVNLDPPTHTEVVNHREPLLYSIKIYNLTATFLIFWFLQSFYPFFNDPFNLGAEGLCYVVRDYSGLIKYWWYFFISLCM